MHMTLEEIREVRAFLRSKGLSDDAIDGAVNSISFHEDTARLKDSEDVKRGRDIMSFKPNPGKATLTQVGETQTYLGGDDRGLPIYQEDVDMIKKALPLAKRLIELQKTKQQAPVDEKQTLRTLRDTIDEVYEIDPEELNMGPDTTENIHEISEEDRMNLEAGWHKVPDQVKESMLRSQGIKKNENTTHEDFPGAGDWKEWRKEHADVLGQMREEEIRDSGDVMFGIDLETQGLQGNFEPREQWEEYYLKHHLLKPGLDKKGVIDDKPYPTTSEMKEYIDEQCNKNVSKDENKKDPGDYYKYGNILRRMDDTHTRKNSDYGDAAYKGYKKYGDYYFLVQLSNKLSRLESLTIGNKTQQVKDESIDDTLLDLANYAVMYLESRHRND